jgi:hypothetical protein
VRIGNSIRVRPSDLDALWTPDMEVQAKANEQRQGGVREAWEAYLGQFSWDLWATLTFRAAEVSLHTAFSRLTEVCRRLALNAEGHIRVAFACGPQRGRIEETPHFHLLLGRIDQADPPIATDELARLWQFGDTKVEVYKPGGGAAGYMAEHDVIDMAVACPSRACWRRRPCPIARTPWPSADALFLSN